jgi:hypothetical protein
LNNLSPPQWRAPLDHSPSHARYLTSEKMQKVTITLTSVFSAPCVTVGFQFSQACYVCNKVCGPIHSEGRYFLPPPKWANSSDRQRLQTNPKKNPSPVRRRTGPAQHIVKMNEFCCHQSLGLGLWTSDLGPRTFPPLSCQTSSNLVKPRQG